MAARSAQKALIHQCFHGYSLITQNVMPIKESFALLGDTKMI
jgi:hypothetical protein